MDVQGVDLPISEPGAAAAYIASRNAKAAPDVNVTHTVTLETPAPVPPAVDDPAAPPPPVGDPNAAAETTWTDPETGEEVPGKPTRYQRRVKKLWERGESERQMREAAEKRATDAEARLAARDAAPRPPAQPAADQPASDAEALTMAAQARIRSKPDRAAIGSTYATYEDYVEDCAIWGGELAAEKRVVIAESRSAQTAQTQAQTVFAQERATASADYPDFDAVTSQDLPLTRAIVDATVHAPAGLKGHVLYWLGKHPAETARIAALSLPAALVEMGMVIATVKAERAAKAPAADTTDKKPKPHSDAPPPPDPLKGGSAQDTPPHRVADPGAARVNPVDFIKSRNADVRSRGLR